jgi:transposase
MGDNIIHNNKAGEKMTRSRRTFSPEFKLESAQLVVDQSYTVKAASK